MKRRHLDPVKDAVLIEIRRETRRLAQIEATKRWKLKNPEKVREQKRRWVTKKRLIKDS